MAMTYILTACNPKDQYSADNQQISLNLRLLSQNEREQDFEQLLSLFKTYYAPYDYKEKLLNINIEKEHAKLKSLAVTAKIDDEFLGYAQQFTALLKDGHVTLRAPISNTGNRSYSIPIWSVPVEDKVLVEYVATDFTKEYNIEIGDEIVEVDDKPVWSYLPKILKYGSFATPESEKHGINSVFFRASSMTELIPSATSVSVKITKKDGTVVHKKIPWQIKKYNQELASVKLNVTTSDYPAKRFDRFDLMKKEMFSNSKGELYSGEATPMYLSNKTKNLYNFIDVKPSKTSLQKVNYTKDQQPEVFSVIYKYLGKVILLVRLHTYTANDNFTDEDYVKYYKALLIEYQDLADILVLDQTHNSGGTFCNQIYDLISKPGDVQSVYALNADRQYLTKLLNTTPNYYNSNSLPLKAKSTMEMGLIVERAYDNKLRLSEPIPYYTDNQPLANYENSVWNKPLLVLIDEVAGSCGDEFPMLVKANKRAPLFGQPTMGLGGGVAEVANLNHSQISVRLTRSLFMPYNKDGNNVFNDAIENRGVEPDIKYKHTVIDFRNDFVSYIKTFSDAAIKEIK